MLRTLILGFVLAGAAVVAQKPPLPPLPPAAPVPPIPALAVVDDEWEHALIEFDRGALDMELARVHAELETMRLDTTPMLADARGALDKARHALFALQAPPAPPAAPAPAAAPRPIKRPTGGSEQSQYRRGQRSLDAREWDRAIEAF